MTAPPVHPCPSPSPPQLGTCTTALAWDRGPGRGPAALAPIGPIRPRGPAMAGPGARAWPRGRGFGHLWAGAPDLTGGPGPEPLGRDGPGGRRARAWARTLAGPRPGWGPVPRCAPMCPGPEPRAQDGPGPGLWAREPGSGPGAVGPGLWARGPGPRAGPGPGMARGPGPGIGPGAQSPPLWPARGSGSRWSQISNRFLTCCSNLR